MKTLKYIMVSLFAILALESCQSDKKSSAQITEVYQCPMQCEVIKHIMNLVAALFVKWT